MPSGSGLASLGMALTAVGATTDGFFFFFFYLTLQSDFVDKNRKWMYL